MKNLKLLSLLFAGALLTVSMSACSDDDDDNPVGSSTETANVLITHASPNAPAVDILVDDAEALGDLAFPDNTGYVTIEAGSRNVKVNAANTTTTVINADLQLAANTNYSVFAIDSLTSIEPLMVTDDLTDPASGNAHVRFIHLSPDAPAVDVALQGGAVVFGNQSFRDFTAFTPLTAGTYDLEVRLAGTTTVVLPLPGITVQDGMIYTVFAKGFVGGSGDQALGAEIIVNK